MSKTVYTVCVFMLTIGVLNGRLLSLNKTITKSGEFPQDRPLFGDGSSYKAVDGNKDRNSDSCGCCAATAHRNNTWFRLDLGKDFIIESYEILGRVQPPGFTSQNFYQHFQNMTISLVNQKNRIVFQQTIPDKVYVVNQSLPSQVEARYVSLQIPRTGHFTLCELSVYGDCVDGRFGVSCDNICHCKDEPCDKSTGVCPSASCKSGFTGEKCTKECQDSTYGENCKETCGNCSNNATCDRTTGYCTGCAPGYVEALCKQECADGFYGRGCSGTCEHCLNKTCDKVDGHCELCPPGYHGLYCDKECPDGSFGSNCSARCHCKGDQCNTVTGECPGFCEPGYVGLACNTTCRYGTFGQNCSSRCGFCADNMTCNHEDGTCDVCLSGYLTDFCNLTCPSRMYGINCTNRCSEHCYADTTCDFQTGHCDLGCDPGYTSEDCNTECDDNHYGRNCMETCGSCSNDTCDKVDGHCTACLNGLTLPLCQQDNKSSTEIWPVLVGTCTGLTVIAAFCIFIAVYTKRRRKKQWQSDISDNLSNRQIRKRNPNKRGYIAEGSSQNMIKIHKEQQEVYYTNMKAEHKVDTKETGNYLKLSFTNTTKQNLDDHIYESLSANHSGLKVCKLWDYITDMKMDSCKKFHQEFQHLPAGPQYPYNMALKYSSQNRYRGIFAYDHNRVPQTVNKPDESEYINASFINGFEKGKKFIACQGPSNRTVREFWRMIWQYNCKQIVILTTPFELETDNCMMYWADEKEVTFGSFSIKPGTLEIVNDYEIRTFEISKNGKPPKSVKQYHYQAWQDRDIPNSPWSLVNFWLRVTKDRGANKGADGPVVVHCSTGVGRTGVYIALDYLYNQGKTEGCVTPFQGVASLFNQRPSMVQTKEQYVFLHEAVAESLLFGTHDLRVDQIKDVYKYLSQNDPVTSLSRMYMQFKLIIDSKENCENEGVNAADNEYVDIDIIRQQVIDGETRVTQQFEAVFTQDYKGELSMIIATTPTSATMETFWSFILENNVKTVVVVTDTTSPNYKQYLHIPGDGKKHSFQLSQLEKKATSHYTDRQIGYTKKKVTKGKVHMIEYIKWTGSQDVPGDCESVIALLNHVLECQERCSDKEPILILCTTGHLKSGLICALLNEFYRIKNGGGHINVVQTVKLLKENQIFAVKSFGQYQFIYDVLIAKACGENIYENI